MYKYNQFVFKNFQNLYFITLLINDVFPLYIKYF